jgi:hypothetical protein
MADGYRSYTLYKPDASRGQMSENYLRRLFNHIDFGNNKDCWNWAGSITENNRYGLFRLNGSQTKAHRFCYELWVGEIPDGMCVCHKCDNPKCVNPDHLFLGTQFDNMVDRTDKNRGYKPIGEKNLFSKLKEKEVLEIRRLYKTRRVSQRYLAKMFLVTASCVENIVSRKSWSYLSEDFQNG